MKVFYNICHRYRVFIGLLLLNVLLFPFFTENSLNTLYISSRNLWNMLIFIPPIFILLGLMDEWIDREKMIKLMGEKSGLRGYGIAFFLGSMAAGPLFVAFPVAAVLIRKGASIGKVIFFIGTWAIMKIPMLLFEASSIGLKYMLIRLPINILGVIVISIIVDRILSEEDRKKILEKCSSVIQ